MESSISPLAKRLAEENNVSWHLLEGSGPSGRVVERDVLEYLARVMSGEAATDPVAEELPEGVDAWPEDMDASNYHAAEQNVTTEDAFGEALLELGTFEDALQSPLAEDNLTEFNFTEALSDNIFVTDEPEDGFEANHKNTHDMDVDDEDVHSSNVYDAGVYETGVHEADVKRNSHADTLPEDMLFGDESTEALFGAPTETPAEDFGAFETEEAGEDESTDAFDGGGLEAEARKAGTSEAEAFDAGTFDDAAFDPELFEPEMHAPNISPSEADADVFLFDAPPAPDASFSRDAKSIKDKGDADSSEARAFSGEFSPEVGDEEAFGAEDAPEAQEDDAFEFEGLEGASEAYSGTSAPVPQESARAFTPELSPDLDPALDDGAASTEDELDFSGRAEAALSTSDSAPPAPAPSKTDGLPNGVPVAPYVLLRRHLDVTALLEAQRAIGLEVNGEVPPTALLLRAALKALHRVPLAASSAEPSEAAVALAVVSADALRISVVPDVDASFVTLLGVVDSTKDAAEEPDTSVDLIVADLSRYNLDEVVLTLGAPVLALSRVGAAEDSIGALSLSGDVAPSWGAGFLTCVAELLASPVRLLI